MEPKKKGKKGEEEEDVVPHPDEPETKFLFQDELNDLYTNLPIEVFYPYSWFFTNFLVFLTYSTPMPLMYVLALIHFILAYVSYKFLFLWYNRIPYGFDECIPLYTVRLMKWGVFLHMLFNCFMLTNKRVLTPTDYTYEDHYRPVGEAPGSFFARRFNIFPNFMVFLVFMVVCVLYLVYKFIL